MSRMNFLVGFCSGLLLLVGAGCGGSIETPTSFQTWNAKDGTFQLEYPDGWAAEGGGKNGIQWARIEMGSAAIRVNISLADSLMGDIANNGAGGFMGEEGMPVEEDPEQSAPAKVHQQNRDRVLEDIGLSSYKEQPGTLLQTELGQAWRTEFTASKGFGSVRGYRTTVLSLNHGVQVVCYCSPGDWEKLKGTYERIIQGLKAGVPQL